MKKILGVLAAAGFILGLTLTPTVFAADTDHSTQHDLVAKEAVDHSLNHDQDGTGEVDHDLVSENEKDEHVVLHEDHESSVAEAHESPTAENHDSGGTVDRHAGSR